MADKMSDLPKLNKDEKKVFSIVKEFSTKKSNFTIDELTKYCKQNTKFSNKKIYSILKDFINKKIIIEENLFNKSQILDIQERYKIYDYISKNPGMEYNALHEKFKLHPKVFKWHIEMLKNFGYIREKSYLFYKIYYHKYFPKENEIRIFIMRDPDIYRIYLLLMNQQLDPESLSKILDIKLSLIKFYLNKMVDAGIIKYENGKTFSINKEKQDFFKNYFDLKIPNNLKERLLDFNELKKLLYLILMKKETGIMIYQYNFIESNIDADLVSGFLTAIQQFGSELNKKACSISKITYKGFEINIEDGNWARAALILDGKSSDSLNKRLSSFISFYENEYKEHFAQWTGDISIFHDSKLIIEDFFSPKSENEKSLIDNGNIGAVNILKDENKNKNQIN